MKKKLLFVIPSLDAGGGEKSLVNLLGAVDKARFDIDVLLFHKTGLFLEMLPPEVNVLEIGGAYRIFSEGVFTSFIKLMLRLNFWTALNRIVFAVKNKMYTNKAVAEQQSWQQISSAIKPLEKKYDAAIGFLEKSSIYLVVDKVKAKTKIGWIHTNYLNSGMDAKFDAPYFSKLDKIVTVSGECAAALGLNFPNETDKIEVIHNIISPEIIHKLAESGNADEMPDDSINIVSVGRLSSEKGFALAVETLAELIEKGINANWFVIGDGREKQTLETQIGSLGLTGKFHLLGAKSNPYTYVKNAAVYVQPSKYEGKSMAIDEAKIIGKPIVVTNYASAKDQIKNGENGLISKMDSESLSDAIIKITSDAILRNRLIENLKKETVTSDTEIEKFYRLIP